MSQPRESLLRDAPIERYASQGAMSFDHERRCHGRVQGSLHYPTTVRVVRAEPAAVGIASTGGIDRFDWHRRHVYRIDSAATYQAALGPELDRHDPWTAGGEGPRSVLWRIATEQKRRLAPTGQEEVDQTKKGVE